jgi:hypothetical protein
VSLLANVAMSSMGGALTMPYHDYGLYPFLSHIPLCPVPIPFHVHYTLPRGILESVVQVITSFHTISSSSITITM